MQAMNNGDNMNTHATQTQTDNMHTQTKQTQELKEIQERRAELLQKWTHKAGLVRDYADWLEGKNGYTPKDPAGFYEINNISAELQELGEELDEIAQEMFELEEREYKTEAGNE